MGRPHRRRRPQAALRRYGREPDPPGHGDTSDAILALKLETGDGLVLWLGRTSEGEPARPRRLLVTGAMTAVGHASRHGETTGSVLSGGSGIGAVLQRDTDQAKSGEPRGDAPSGSA